MGITISQYRNALNLEMRAKCEVKLTEKAFTSHPRGVSMEDGGCDWAHGALHLWRFRLARLVCV